MQAINSNYKLLYLGIYWKIISCACFALNNGCVRLLTNKTINMPSALILAWQNIFALFFLITLFKHNLNYKLNLKINNPKYFALHSLRIISAILGMLSWYVALKYMPIASVVSLSFTGPILGAIGAVIFLKEKLTWQRNLAILFSFIGALIILRPDLKINLDSNLMHLSLPMLAAMFFAISKIITRKLASSNSAAIDLTVYLMLFTTPIAFIFAIPAWRLPVNEEWFFLGLIGIINAYAHYSFTKAYSYSEITVLMPIGFIKFILSVIVGYVLFTEIPSSMIEWFGMGTIFISSILIHLETQRNQAKY